MAHDYPTYPARRASRSALGRCPTKHRRLQRGLALALTELEDAARECTLDAQTHGHKANAATEANGERLLLAVQNFRSAYYQLARADAMAPTPASERALRRTLHFGRQVLLESAPAILSADLPRQEMDR